MNTDEINKAIAEHLGWEDCLNGFGTETRYKGTPSEVRVTVPFPRYSEDLNAMHEAEKALKQKWSNYCGKLLEIVEPEPRSLEVCHYWNLLHATAAQRAEAFLRTVGKWRDS